MKNEAGIRDMVDAIREIQGLRPLYNDGAEVQKTAERFSGHVYSERTNGMTPRRGAQS
jgi:hypothetical protein